jgi:uncharacterized protein (DUF58 family)
MRNFGLLQFMLFAGAALVGLAALNAAGVVAGVALGWAAVLAVLTLAVWMIIANLIAAERPVRRRRRPQPHPVR